MTSDATATRTASDIMRAFAERTGLTSSAPVRRYLWTDAFAVCNYLGLARATGERRYLDLALRLVDQVHAVLGRHRPEGPDTGWLSGLDDRDAAAHPTRGGLRIGKQLPEREPGEPFDDRLEWDRDGQYFHYLTKWMHALDQTARATGEPRFNVWARELAEVAGRAFVGPGGVRMFWKMSTDLSRPLVTSMGQHDPLDGLITCLQLHATAAELGVTGAGPNAAQIATRFATMIVGQDFATADPLGLGGLLADAGRVDQLLARRAYSDGALLDKLLASGLAGLPQFVAHADLHEPASRRLAFRELGLSIGLHALEIMRERLGERGTRTLALLRALAGYESLAGAIQSFWLEPAHQHVQTWTEHRDINEVMLATSLAPQGFLALRSLRDGPDRGTDLAPA